MIQSEVFYNKLKSHGVNLFTGVPDSLLKDFCAFVDDNVEKGKHIITANEGNAIAVAAGYHMATGNVAAVYMQNSGLGNTVNPLTSLADKEVYRIPLVMIIGWRGEPGVKDEPQHVKQGRITPGQLDLLEVPYWIVGPDSNVDLLMNEVFAKVEATNAPVALLVKSGTFAPYKSKRKSNLAYELTREEALKNILSLLGSNDVVVSTTGKTSREVFELRLQQGTGQRDFLTVGGMGHTASIGLGVALGAKNKRVVCLDGDGSVLMHMGALPIIGDLAPKNFVHVLLNNSAHESVGGQPTVAGNLNFEAIAKACGYSSYFQVSTVEDLKRQWQVLAEKQGPILFEVKIKVGSRENIGRPTSTPEQNKKSFMDAVRGSV